ncbi:methyltransferase domain-containing protein [Streptomyces sp. L7]
MRINFQKTLLKAIPVVDVQSVVVEIGAGRESLDLVGCRYLSVDSRILTAPYIVGSVDSLPIRSNSADVVLGSRLLCSVHSIPRALREIRRVLKPHGVYIGIEHCRDPALPLAEIQSIRNVFRAKRGLCRLGVDVGAELFAAGYEVSIARKPYPANPVLVFVATLA